MRMFVNMFKFNFSIVKTKDANTEEHKCEEVNWHACEEIQPNNEYLNTFLSTNSGHKNGILSYEKELKIKHVLPEVVISRLKRNPQSNSVLHADRNHSDLETGIYEGGLKIWECTHDLANYICNNKLDLTNKNVLDLGCGTGIIGILSLLKGSYCDFQDYNEEVISFITIPNVALNAYNKLPVCKFYSGDWISFLSKILDKKYDIIFTCETIYNAGNYQKLNSVFKSLLQKDGVVYLAAKSYYFGVGGGLREFEDVIKQEGVFEYFTCWKCLEGVQREILALKFKS